MNPSNQAITPDTPAGVSPDQLSELAQVRDMAGVTFHLEPDDASETPKQEAQDCAGHPDPNADAEEISFQSISIFENSLVERRALIEHVLADAALRDILHPMPAPDDVSALREKMYSEAVHAAYSDAMAYIRKKAQQIAVTEEEMIQIRVRAEEANAIIQGIMDAAGPIFGIGNPSTAETQPQNPDATSAPDAAPAPEAPQAATASEAPAQPKPPRVAPVPIGGQARARLRSIARKELAGNPLSPEDKEWAQGLLRDEATRKQAASIITKVKEAHEARAAASVTSDQQGA